MSQLSGIWRSTGCPTVSSRDLRIAIARSLRQLQPDTSSMIQVTATRHLALRSTWCAYPNQDWCLIDYADGGPTSWGRTRPSTSLGISGTLCLSSRWLYKTSCGRALQPFLSRIFSVRAIMPIFEAGLSRMGTSSIEWYVLCFWSPRIVTSTRTGTLRLQCFYAFVCKLRLPLHQLKVDSISF